MSRWPELDEEPVALMVTESDDSTPGVGFPIYLDTQSGAHVIKDMSLVYEMGALARPARLGGLTRVPSH